MRRGYLVSLVLVGCSEPSMPAPPTVHEVPGEQVPAAPAVEVPAVEVPVIAAPVVAPAASPVEVSEFPTAITRRGIGPFGPGLKGDLAAIRRLAPGFTVTSRRDESESHDIEDVALARAGKPVLTMLLNHYRGNDPLFTITARDPMFVTETGVAVGSTVKALVARHPDTVCMFEEYDPSLDVLAVERRMYCETGDLPNISFELDATTWKGKAGKLASAEVADREIVTIVWLTST